MKDGWRRADCFSWRLDCWFADIGAVFLVNTFCVQHIHIDTFARVDFLFYNTCAQIYNMCTNPQIFIQIQQICSFAQDS